MQRVHLILIRLILLLLKFTSPTRSPKNNACCVNVRICFVQLFLTCTPGSLCATEVLLAMIYWLLFCDVSGSVLELLSCDLLLSLWKSGLTNLLPLVFYNLARKPLLFYFQHRYLFFVTTVPVFTIFYSAQMTTNIQVKAIPWVPILLRICLEFYSIFF
jgi:hypothetical protein